MLETKIDVKKTALLIIDMQNDLIKAKEEPFSLVFYPEGLSQGRTSKNLRRDDNDNIWSQRLKKGCL